MEKLLVESTEPLQSKEFCQKRNFVKKLQEVLVHPQLVLANLLLNGLRYDVDMFLTHRFLSSGEAAEVRVRFVGFGLKMMNGLMLKRRYESDPSHLSILNVIR